MTVKLYEGDKTEVGGDGIEITDNKVVNLKLREENNLIQINPDQEAYVDLQLPDGIAPDDDFPIGVNTGRVLVADGRPVSGTVTVSKTTSGDQTMYLYGDDGKVYVDNGTGVWKILGRPEFVTQAEYDALPNTKLTDNVLRIVVDYHRLMEYSELTALASEQEILAELNSHALDYYNKYLGENHIYLAYKALSDDGTNAGMFWLGTEVFQYDIFNDGVWSANEIHE